MRRSFLIVVLSAALFGTAHAALDLTIVRLSGPSDSIRLQWNAENGAHQYRVFYTHDLAFEFNEISRTPSAVRQFTEAWAGSATRFYHVEAWDTTANNRLARSDTVGYSVTTTTNAANGSTTHTPFGIAFRTWDVPNANAPAYGVNSTKPSDIVLDQATCGTVVTADRIVRQDNGEFAYRSQADGCDWKNNLETNSNMSPGRAYWYTNKGHGEIEFLIFGAADRNSTYLNLAVTAPDSTQTVTFTSMSWREPRVRNRDVLQLRTQGFTGGTVTTSDRVLRQVSGDFLYYRTADNTWQGTLETIIPGNAYWISNKHRNHAWNYNYDPRNSDP